jgi:hypothetical protein
MEALIRFAHPNESIVRGKSKKYAVAIAAMA